MLKINIKTIPHSEQRYPTVGDWVWTPVIVVDPAKNPTVIQCDVLDITVSDMNNWKYEFLVAFHELAEVMLCKEREISQESVDGFDIAFEKLRQLAPVIIGNQEPGNMVSAPYNKEHLSATSIEKYMAVELGVSWDDYEKVVDSL